jgi:hypothetical protein
MLLLSLRFVLRHAAVFAFSPCRFSFRRLSPPSLCRFDRCLRDDAAAAAAYAERCCRYAYTRRRDYASITLKAITTADFHCHYATMSFERQLY